MKIENDSKVAFVMAYLIKIFDFKSQFILNKFENENVLCYEKIVKCLIYNEYYNGSYMVSKELRNFINNSLFKRDKLVLLDNEKDITDFILAYNYCISYVEFKKCYESHKFNYIKLIGNKGKQFIFVSIKSNIIDKCKTYIIVEKELYDYIMNNYDITDSYKDYKLDIFNNCLIKDKNLKVPNKRVICLESLIDIFYDYKKSICIDNETYTLSKNEFDNESYYRFLVSEYYDYYSTKDSLNEFYDYLTNEKGLNLDMTLNEWLNLKIGCSDNSIIDYMLYNQTINYIETNLKGYDLRVYKLKELRDKRLKFSKNVVLFIFKDTFVYSQLNKFLETL